jgi:hypothetical protein
MKHIKSFQQLNEDTEPLYSNDPRVDRIGKPISNIRIQVKPATDENGRYKHNSIFRYFARIFYLQRGGFFDFSDYEFDRLSGETKDYLIRIYHQLKTLVPSYRVHDAEKEIEKLKARKRDVSVDIAKWKERDGMDFFFDYDPVNTDRKRIDYAVLFLSNDLSGRDNGITDGINRATRVKKFEYPSQDVLKNLDEVFRGESAKYDAELAALEGATVSDKKTY